MSKQAPQFARVVYYDGEGGQITITDPVETLGRYNAERSRGIVHTPEWRIAMARLQREFDAQQGPPDDRP